MTTAADVMRRLREQDAGKDSGNLAAIILLERDPLYLTPLVAVWPNVPRPPLPLATVAPEALPDDRLTRWLWSLLEPDPFSTWCEVAGLPVADHVRRAAQVAIDNRMVFPDGTLSRWTQQYIRNVVGGTLARRGVKELPPAPAPAAPPPAQTSAPGRTP